MDAISSLFGSANKVKVIRLFVYNPEGLFDLKQMSGVIRLNPAAIRKELKLLEDISFVKSKIIARKEGQKDISARVKVWGLNPLFPFIENLRGILGYEMAIRKEEITKRFRNSGKIKLLLLAGMFLKTTEGCVDFLIVGDSLKKSAIEREIHKLEAEIGKELNYAILDTEDFNFRYYSGDKFIRDVFDYPYESLVDKIGL